MSRIEDTIAVAENIEKKLEAEAVLGKGSGVFPTYLVTSCCGGSGAGMFLDMLYKVYEAIQRKAGGKSPQIRAVIFLPSIFEKEVKKSSGELPALHRANAYAFFKELESLIGNPLEIENCCLDAFQRKERQVPPLSEWYPFNRAYLIDRHLGEIGVIDDPLEMAEPAFLTELYTQRDFVELSLIRNGERFIDEDYAVLEPELVDASKQEVAQFVNRCEYGVGFAQMVHVGLEKELEEALKIVSEQRKRAMEAINEARARRDTLIDEVDTLLKNWFAKVRVGKLKGLVSDFVNALRGYLEASLEEHLLSKQEAYLTKLAGHSWKADIKVGDVVIDKEVKKDLTDEQHRWLERIEGRLREILKRASEMKGAALYVGEDERQTVTKRAFPEVAEFPRSERIEKLSPTWNSPRGVGTSHPTSRPAGRNTLTACPTSCRRRRWSMRS